MRSKWVINLCLFNLIIAASTLLAQTQQEAAELPAGTEPVQATIVENLPEAKPADEAVEGGVKATLSKQESPEPTAELSRSTRTGISSAIGSFIPTEEISADNAVPFPVDI